MKFRGSCKFLVTLRARMGPVCGMQPTRVIGKTVFTGKLVFTVFTVVGPLTCMSSDMVPHVFWFETLVRTLITFEYAFRKLLPSLVASHFAVGFLDALVHSRELYFYGSRHRFWIIFVARLRIFSSMILCRYQLTLRSFLVDLGLFLVG